MVPEHEGWPLVRVLDDASEVEDAADVNEHLRVSQDPRTRGRSVCNERKTEVQQNRNFSSFPWLENLLPKVCLSSILWF